MIKYIFLDLDDVLNRLVETAFSYYGLSGPYPAGFGWNVSGAANHLAGTERFTRESFWGALPRDMWATVPKSTICDWLVDKAAAMVGKANVFILTSPVFNPACLAGKTDWIIANLPAWLHGQVHIGSHKALLAGRGRLLIDDADHNVQAWDDAGGWSILVPQPWNANCLLDTDFYVDQRLAPWMGKYATA